MMQPGFSWFPPFMRLIIVAIRLDKTRLIAGFVFSVASKLRDVLRFECISPHQKQLSKITAIATQTQKWEYQQKNGKITAPSELLYKTYTCRTLKIKWESKGKFAIHCKLLIIKNNNIYNIYNGSIYTYILFISIFYCIYIHMYHYLFLFLNMGIYTKSAPNRPIWQKLAVFLFIINSLT